MIRPGHEGAGRVPEAKRSTGDMPPADVPTVVVPVDGEAGSIPVLPPPVVKPLIDGSDVELPSFKEPVAKPKTARCFDEEAAAETAAETVVKSRPGGLNVFTGFGAGGDDLADHLGGRDMDTPFRMHEELLAEQAALDLAAETAEREIERFKGEYSITVDDRMAPVLILTFSNREMEPVRVIVNEEKEISRGVSSIVRPGILLNPDGSTQNVVLKYSNYMKMGKEMSGDAKKGSRQEKGHNALRRSEQEFRYQKEFNGHESIVSSLAFGVDDVYSITIQNRCMSTLKIIQDRLVGNQDACMTVLGGILRTIEPLHTSGYMYRDIKPENLLFDDTGNIQLSDFGLVTANKARSLVGTTCYLPAPSSVEVSLELQTQKTDMFSIGALMVRLFAPDIFDECLDFKGYMNVEALNQLVLDRFPTGPLKDVVLGLINPVPEERLDARVAIGIVDAFPSVPLVDPEVLAFSEADIADLEALQAVASTLTSYREKMDRVAEELKVHSEGPPVVELGDIDIEGVD